MNAKLRRKVKERKRKMRSRIDKFEGPWSSPMITPPAKGRAIDNVMIERLWRSVKYEDAYLKEYATGTDLYKGLRSYFDFYTRE